MTSPFLQWFFRKVIWEKSIDTLGEGRIKGKREEEKYGAKKGRLVNTVKSFI